MLLLLPFWSLQDPLSIIYKPLLLPSTQVSSYIYYHKFFKVWPCHLKHFMCHPEVYTLHFYDPWSPTSTMLMSTISCVHHPVYKLLYLPPLGPQGSSSAILKFYKFFLLLLNSTYPYPSHFKVYELLHQPSPDPQANSPVMCRFKIFFALHMEV